MENKGSLLIADDEEVILSTLVEMLAPLGYKILTAKSGDELISVAENKNNNVIAILSDIHMPNLNGIEALKKLREKNISVPVVFLTGYGNKDLVIESLRLGAFDFVDKPFDYNQLKETVRKSLEVGESLKMIEKEISSLKSSFKGMEKETEDFLSAKKVLLEMKAKNSVFFKK